MADAIEATGALLRAVFPRSHIGDAAYLRWLYEQSPFGPVVECNLDDAGGRAGHYAVVPIDLSLDGVTRSGALSLNTAVAERARGGGVFTGLAEAAFAAARDRGIETVLGVANANSTPGFVRRLGFTNLGELPVTVILPRPGAGPRLATATGDEAVRVAGDTDPALLAAPAQGLARHWTPEGLRWRLRAPAGQYTVHHSPEVLAVTTLAVHAGVRVAVVLKVFAAESLSNADTRAVTWSAARAHRAPLALWAGHSEVYRPSGIPLPQRLRPSPLNLIRRDLDPSAAGGNITRFEFLDFDAY